MRPPIPPRAGSPCVPLRAGHPLAAEERVLVSLQGPCLLAPSSFLRLGVGGLPSSNRCSGADPALRADGWTERKCPTSILEETRRPVSLEHLGTSQIRGFLWGCLGPETAGICPYPAAEAGFQAPSTYHTLFCASAPGPASLLGAEPDWRPLCCPTVSQGQGHGWGSICV